MERKDFLKNTLALCGISLLPAGVMESCTKHSYGGPSNVNLSLDLTNSAYSALNTVGGFVYAGGLIIIRVNTSTFDALSATCTHQGCQVGYNTSNGYVQCPCHGGMYNASTGAVVSGPPPSALTTYKTSLTGNILTVKS